MLLSSKHALLIFNPVAGHYKPRRLQLFVKNLQKLGWNVALSPTAYPGHGGGVAKEALAQGDIDLIIVGGGDGTISEIAEQLLGSSVPLAIFPIGSANVLARELEIPFNDYENTLMIERIFTQSAAKKIWPGIINAPEGKTIFIQMAGIGPDGWIVRNVSTHLKKYIGRSAYVLSALKCILLYKFTPFTLFLDNKEENLTAAIITKGRYYGGKFQIIPTSPQQFHNFEVILFRCQTMFSFLKSIISFFLFRNKNEFIEIRTVQNAQIPAHQKIDLQIDGDAHEISKADISVSDKPLRIIAP